jgi:hypothetical protein
MNTRTLALVSAMAVALPMTAAAQSRLPQAGPRIQTQSPAFRTGFDRGLRVGEEDGRRNSRFDYASKSEVPQRRRWIQPQLRRPRALPFRIPRGI